MRQRRLAPARQLLPAGACGAMLLTLGAGEAPREVPRVQARVFPPSSVRSCCTGRHLKLGLPRLTVHPFWTYDNDTGKYDGHLAQVVDKLALEMGLTYEVVADPLGLTESALALVSGQTDASVVHISQEMYQVDLLETFVYTTPLWTSYNGALVYRERAPSSLWRLFDPFTPLMWAMCATCIGLLTGTMLLVARISPVAHRRDPATDFRARIIRLTYSVYHSFAFMLGGEDIEWFTWSGRVLRLTFLFTVLIITSTYTANLAAFFTAPAWKIHGPKDMQQLRTARACSLWDNQSYVLPDNTTGVLMNPVVAYVGELIAPPQSISYDEQVRWCHSALKDRRADVFIQDVAVLREYLLRHCGDLVHVSTIHLIPQLGVLRLRRSDQALAANLSAAIVHFISSPEHQAMMAETFAIGRTCPDTSAGDTSQVDIDSQGGMFIITCGGAALAVVVALLERLYQLAGGPVDPDSEENLGVPTTEGEMLQLVLRRLEDLQVHARRNSNYSTSTAPRQQLPGDPCDAPALPQVPDSPE
eukprot:TRINITY_DN17931_c0_g1_i1.p1 TRINITY_DN17931_c0_g1~~TRINITY_DN17931_c0_g1_i1.p1  ORF type:complete len:530 (+),score=116.54 TRINITY_DN17931_c0_g1_i1:122-1711(+)